MKRQFCYRDIGDFFRVSSQAAPAICKRYWGHKGRLRITNPDYDPEIKFKAISSGQTVAYFKHTEGIRIICSDSGCRAQWYDQELKSYNDIGEATLSYDNWLSHIEVDDAHRKKGIATAMIKVLIKQFPDFKVPYHGNETDHKDLHLTTHGKVFVKRLIEREILKPHHWDVPVPQTPAASLIF